MNKYDIADWIELLSHRDHIFFIQELKKSKSVEYHYACRKLLNDKYPTLGVLYGV